MKPAIQTAKVESRQSSTSADKLLIQALAKIDRSALGAAMGTVFGLSLFLGTNFLILKNAEQASRALGVLNQYFFGYTVTFGGSFVGLFYGFATGFALGWLAAFLRNFVIRIYLHVAKYKERMISVNNFIDYP